MSEVRIGRREAMSGEIEHSFQRYLAAKKSVDDRALNRHVWDAFRGAVAGRGSLRVLEVGGGIGAMAERLIDWDLLGARCRGEPATLKLTLLDAIPDNIAEAHRRLAAWGAARGFDAQAVAGGIRLRSGDLDVDITLLTADLFDFATRATDERWDAVVAHAVLDLLDAREALRTLRGLLRPGGLLFAAITFDGVTALEPAIDPALDALVEDLYHRTMDGRVAGGRPAGDAHAGRHLYHHLRGSGFDVLAIGGSDWVVCPGPDGYRGDEAYFLHFIVDTIAAALRGNAALDARRFAAWVEERHRQIERLELLYIAHQMDVLARTPSAELL